MDKFLTLLVSGAASGMIYSLIATGLVLSFSATGIFNLAFGGVAFCAAFLYYELVVGLGWSNPTAAGFTVLVAAPLLGVILDVAVFRPLARATDAAKVMATVGLLIALPALARWSVELLVEVFDREIPLGDQIYLPPNVGPSTKVQWTLPGGGLFDSNQLVVVIAAVLVAVGLWVLLRWTRIGLNMRAVVDRPELAEMRGINVARVSRTSWVIGTMLAALAGVVGAPVLGSLDVSTYIFAVFVATAAAVCGRLRSVPLAFVGGLVLGATQNMVAGYLPLARSIQGFSASVPFVILLVGLLLLGRSRSRVAGTVASDRAPVDHTSDLGPFRRLAPSVVLLVGFAVYLLFIADGFWLGVVSRGLVVGVILLSFVVVTGMGGMVSLSQAAFVTMAGLTAGWCINELGMTFVPALLVAIVAAVALGMLAALPALRLGGLSLALATLALGFLGDKVLFPWEPLSGGRSGWKIPRPTMGFINLEDERTFAVAILIIALGVVALIRNLQNSPTGRAMIALRNTEAGAASSGISPVRVKLVVFSVSAAIAGLGGVLLATHARSATYQSTPTSQGLLWLAAAVLIGIRRPVGAMVAGVATVVFPQVLSNGLHWPAFVPDALNWDGTSSVWIAPVLFGLGAIQLARNPDGLASLQSAKNRARRDAKRVTTATPVLDSEVGVFASTELDPAGAGAGESGGGSVAFEIEGLRASHGGTEAVHGIDLVVRKGTAMALLGPNGAGKSTLCGALSGINPETSGTVAINGRSVDRERASARPGVGLLVAPESRGIFPSLTVDENLRIWLDTSQERNEAYERFPHLEQRRGVAAGNLSGGEQQILTLAPLLVRPPLVLIADEPTLGLAPTVVSQICTMLAELRDRGVTLLLVEEKAPAIVALVDEVAIMSLGKLVWTGRPDQLSDEILRSTYLGDVAAAR